MDPDVAFCWNAPQGDGYFIESGPSGLALGVTRGEREDVFKMLTGNICCYKLRAQFNY